jgi:hypothetical protein
MMDTLPFDAVDAERMEIDRRAQLLALREDARREECHGCAEDWPVKRMERIGRSGMFHLIHTGPRKQDGACWCQCPHLHPANEGGETR